MEIAQPNPVNIIVDVTDVTCAGLENGKIVFTTNGGAYAFSYSVDSLHFSGSNALLASPPGLSSLCPGRQRLHLPRWAVVEEPPAIDLALGPDIDLVLGDSVVLLPSVANGQGVLTYNWKPEYPGSTTCTDTTCTSLLVKPQNDIAVGLVLVDEKGCLASDQVLIRVAKPRGVFVPSGFTPNGDGENELLTVLGKSKTIRQINVFRIFDRWGNQVYEDKEFAPNDPTRGWDGTFKGDKAAVGQYVWFVEALYIDGFKESVKGGTMLLR